MKGKVRKFNFRARTLDDDIVKDGIEAIGVLNGKEPYFLVGGIASQSYLPTKCRRPTSDIDSALVRPLSKPDFRIMIIPVREYLHDMGYDTLPRISNRSRSFALYVSKSYDEGENSLCLEFMRKNKKNFKKHKDRLEREYNNTKKKIMEERKTIYRVSSPEDIAVPKLVRLINSVQRNPKFIQQIPTKLESLSGKTIKKRLEVINAIRSEAVSNPGDPYLAEKLRFFSDIYDIRILSELTGFNPEYFNRAEQDWYDIKKNQELRKKIFSAILPIFFGKSTR